MKWLKEKHIFSPEKNHSWMQSHAANPFAVWQHDDIFRVYFTCRDCGNRSHIGFVDIDFSDSYKVVRISESPVLAPGDLGLFDDSGVAMGYLISVHFQTYLYYLGWNLKVTVPWLNTIGLALFNEQKKEFEKYSLAPIMDRSQEDPYSISYPSILYESGLFQMWYGSNLKWGKTQDEMMHVIKYAESTDGIQWKRTNEIHIDLMHPHEYALSKPFVVKFLGGYKMWYSYRGNGDIRTYRIGYAESSDGHRWQRKDDKSGIDVSDTGWDSEMICYPFIFSHKDKTFMVYNGNGYGKTGFGIAVLQ